MKSDDLAKVRNTLWKAADELRANSTLTPADYRGPVLGLIFLAYAEHRFEAVRPEGVGGATSEPAQGGVNARHHRGQRLVSDG